MTSFVRRISLAAIAVTLTACALSPEIISIEPQLSVTKRAVEPPLALSLSVVDSRPDNVIGTRGGIYADTSTITPAGDVAQPIYEALVKALGETGLTVAPNAARRMTVEVTQLSYAATGAPYVRSVKIAASVKVTGESGLRRYTSEYRSSESKDVLKPPNVEETERLINNVLSKALGRLVEDQALLSFMTE